MLRKDMVEELSRRMDMPKDFSRRVIDAYEEIMFDTLTSGENIRFTDMFKAEIKVSQSTVRYNPVYGKKVFCPSHYRLSMKPIGKLKRAIEEQEVATSDLTPKERGGGMNG